jgi:hypothetical protein
MNHLHRVTPVRRDAGRLPHLAVRVVVNVPAPSASDILEMTNLRAIRGEEQMVMID